MELQFLGSGDAFGSGGRFNTCFHVRHRAGTFLIDCGASSMIAMRKFQVDPNAVDAVFISHLHGDHFGGLPFFILDAQMISRRTAPLVLIGPPGLKDRLEGAMENAFPGSSQVQRRFPLEIRELEPRTAHAVAGVTVTPYVVKHACGAPPFALRFQVDGKTLTYSGDTEWVEDLAEAARGADLFICECYAFEPPVKFHMDLPTLAAHLPGIGAKRVILTHMGAQMLARAQESGYEAAEDGLIVSL